MALRGADTMRVTPPAPPRRRGAAIAAVALALVAQASPAVADPGDAAAARATARRAAADVDALRDRADAALRAYDRALAAVSANVTTGVRADARADEAAARARADAAAATAQVRAVYMGGGPTALYVGVLEARGIGDAVHRVTVVERVMASSAVRSRTARARSQALAKDAEALDVAADEAVVTARDVEAEWVRLQQLLADGTQRLAVLTERARATEEAERAAAALAELRRRVAATMAARVATARAVTVPGGYFALYRRAATSCAGLPWTVLGAIGQVETGHGRNVGPSSAGAMGPMQFMPATWAAYAVDGDRDGDADILDPVDSVYTAARYLCANGAGRGGATLARAIWHYNHAEWYVQLVLRIAAQLAVKPPAA